MNRAISLKQALKAFLNVPIPALLAAYLIGLQDKYMLVRVRERNRDWQISNYRCAVEINMQMRWKRQGENINVLINKSV